MAGTEAAEGLTQLESSINGVMKRKMEKASERLQVQQRTYNNVLYTGSNVSYIFPVPASTVVSARHISFFFSGFNFGSAWDRAVVS